MATTVQSLASGIAHPFGEDYSDLDIKETFDTWVADGLDEVLHNDEWPFQIIVGNITTVADQQSYVSPDTIWDVKHIAIGGEAPLTQTTREKLLKAGYDLSDTGTPSHWFHAGVNSSSQALIGFWPAPSTADVVYDVVGGKVSGTDIVDPTVSLSLPPDIINLVKHYVREQYYRSIGNNDAARVELGRRRRKTPKVRKRHMHIGNRPRTAKWRDVPRTGGRFLNLPSDFGE